MSKALFGHMGGHDARLVSEVARLRLRVRELEAEVTMLRTEAMERAVADVHLEDVHLDEVLGLDRATPAMA